MDNLAFADFRRAIRCIVASFVGLSCLLFAGQIAFAGWQWSCFCVYASVFSDSVDGVRVMQAESKG